MSIANVNYIAIIRIIGIMLLILGIAMIVPWIYAAATDDSTTLGAFRSCSIICMVSGAAVVLIIKSQRGKFRAREGYIIVSVCWIIASVVGAFPYYLSGFADNYIDAFFESTAGFTTTGSTVITAAATPNSLILWKALSNWMGGMGILLFVISILPALGINANVIVKAETPGPTFEKTTVKISDSAKVLYLTYLSFTLIEFILLLLSGKMSSFEALINTMGSVSTGGIIVNPFGVAEYDSLYVEIVISIFCLLASVNFIMYNYLITGKVRVIFKDVELRVFFAVIAIAIVICTFGMYAYSDSSFATSLRDSFFQVVSMATTAGYARPSHLILPSMCQLILIMLMIMGGCASSTSGSMKMIRIIVMFKLIARECYKKIHPRSVTPVRIGKDILSASVVSQITAFILTYAFVFLLSTFILSFQGLDLETTTTSALAMISNTGVGFGATTSVGNFAMFHPVLKLYLSFLMIVGRLELFTIVVLFTRNFWGRNK